MSEGRREAREFERIRMAEAAARAASGSALDAALAEYRRGVRRDRGDFRFQAQGRAHSVPRTGASGGAGAVWRTRRDAVRIAARLAVARAERWWRDERKAFQIASALGYGNRLSLDVLRELRVILRLMRYRHMHAQFGAIVAAVCDGAMPLAAE